MKGFFEGSGALLAPADLRIVPPAPIDEDAEEQRLLRELDDRVAARRELAAQTLNALRGADAL